MEKLKGLYRKFRKEQCFYFVAFMCNTLLNLRLINLLQKLIDTATEMDVSHFWTLMIKFMGILAVYIAVIVWDQYAYRTLENYGETELKKYTYKMFLQNANPEKGKDLGETVSAVNNDVSVMSKWFSSGCINMAAQIILLLLYLFLMAGYDIIITIVTILVIAGVFILSEIFGEKEALFTSRQQALYGKINSYLYDCLANFPVVGQLHNGKYLCGRLRGLHKRGSREVIRGLSRYMALSDAMLTFMTNTLPLLAFALGLLFAKKGWMTTGETIAVMLLAQKLNEPIILLSYLILDKKNAQGVYDRVKDIYEGTPDAGGDKKAEAFENMQVAITEYRYENADKAALCDVRFTIEKGDVVLLKGESGAGKTTAIKLLSRLTSLQGLRGKIQYNDRNISEYDTKEYYKHVLQVEQETVLVEGSVLENLLLGEHYEEGDIREVLHVCVLEDFCRERGMDFHIKESGKNISGGERQRIGIARMLLRKPELLILDEVTSALDETTRQLLADRLIAFQKRYRMTIVAISHNKEFEKYSNRIIGL